jgi:hypothetical protein
MQEDQVLHQYLVQSHQQAAEVEVDMVYHMEVDQEELMDYQEDQVEAELL